MKTASLCLLILLSTAYITPTLAADSTFYNNHVPVGAPSGTEFYFKDTKTIFSLRDTMEDTFALINVSELPKQIKGDNRYYYYKSAQAYTEALTTNPLSKLGATKTNKYIKVQKGMPTIGSLVSLLGNAVGSEESIAVYSGTGFGPKPALLVKVESALAFSPEYQKMIGGLTEGPLLETWRQMSKSKQGAIVLTGDMGEEVRFDFYVAGTSVQDLGAYIPGWKAIGSQPGTTYLRPGATYTMTFELTSNNIIVDYIGSGSTTFTISDSGIVTIDSGDEIAQKSPANNAALKTGNMFFFIPTTVTQADAVTKAMTAVVGTLTAGLVQWIKMFGGWINNILVNSNNISGSAGLKKAWGNILNVTLSLLTLALLIIAFANIINLDEKLGYGLNRMIPKIILSIFMAYFSFMVARVLLDLTNAFQASLFNMPGAQLGADAAINLPISGAQMAESLSNALIMSLLVVILMLFVFLVFVWLCILLLVRYAMIWILVALAPAAMLMNIMPFSESFYKKWWTEWWKWLFMGPAIAVMLYLAGVILGSGVTAFAGGGGTEAYLSLVLAAVCIGMAGVIPLSMGKNIYGGIQKAGKSAMGYAKTGDKYLNKGRVTNSMALRRQNIDSRHKALASEGIAKRATSGTRTGRFMAGVDQKQASEFDNLLTEQKKKQLVDQGIDKATARESYKTVGGRDRSALARLMAEEGWHDGEDNGNLQRLVEDFQDPVVWNKLLGKSPELLSTIEDKIKDGTVTTPAGLPTYMNISGEAGKARAKGMGTVTDFKPEQATQIVKGRGSDPALDGEFRRYVTTLEKMKKQFEAGNERTTAVLGEGLKALSHDAQTGEINDPTMISALQQLTAEQQNEMKSMWKRMEAKTDEFHATPDGTGKVNPDGSPVTKKTFVETK